jgi:hemerythrin superfamily protein
MAQHKRQRDSRRDSKKGSGLKAMAGAVLGGISKIARAMGSDDNLDATDLLKAQHRYVEKLFAEIQKSTGARKAAAFRELADMLAVHATIEEKIFYPNVKTARTEDMLAESVEEHLAMKRTLADLMEMDTNGEDFDATLKVLEEEVTHHAKQEEERKLFPLVRAEQDEDFRAALAGEMIALMVALDQRGNPRAAVPSETSAPAPI